MPSTYRTITPSAGGSPRSGLTGIELERRPSVTGDALPDSGFPHPCLGQSQPESLLPSVALDHIDHHRCKNRRVTDDSNGQLLKPLLAPDEGAIGVTSDVGVTVENDAKMRCPAQLRVHEALKLLGIATSECLRALLCGGDDFLFIRWHRPESKHAGVCLMSRTRSYVFARRCSMTRRISSRFFASFIHFGNLYASCRFPEGEG